MYTYFSIGHPPPPLTHGSICEDDVHIQVEKDDAGHEFETDFHDPLVELEPGGLDHLHVSVAYVDHLS